MNIIPELAKILGTREDVLEELQANMLAHTGLKNVLEQLYMENRAQAERVRSALGVSRDEQLVPRLREAILSHEIQLKRILAQTPGGDDFDRAAALARGIGKVNNGFFLKKDFGSEILRQRPPQNLLKFLGLNSVEELLSAHDVTEIFSALRFMESNQWMHETFDAAYSRFTPRDFEERPIEIRVLGPEWREVAEKFVAKKHHNVSHLKEFGVIFLNPIQEDTPGKMIRDFALLLHYLHEIEFYSNLFRLNSQSPHFAERLKSFLRGDVREKVSGLESGEWLMVQRYLVKEDPADPRLLLPRVNPESIHWRKGEQDLVRFASTRKDLDLELWSDCDWVATAISNSNILVSFDLEDVAMSAVSFVEGKPMILNYHQREAMWTRLACLYAGGEERLEGLVLDHFAEGSIRF